MKLFKKEHLSGTFGGVIEIIYITAIGIATAIAIICIPKVLSFLSVSGG